MLLLTLLATTEPCTYMQAMTDREHCFDRDTADQKQQRLLMMSLMRPYLQTLDSSHFC